MRIEKEMATEWTPVEKELPEEGGEYLVSMEARFTGTFAYVDIAHFTEDLYAVNDYEFQDKKGIAGFYKHSSEWGEDYEVNPIAWQPLPEPYKEKIK
jgi:hypothetical protein